MIQFNLMDLQTDVFRLFDIYICGVIFNIRKGLEQIFQLYIANRPLEFVNFVEDSHSFEISFIEMIFPNIALELCLRYKGNLY